MIHELKIWPRGFHAVKTGNSTAQFRKNDDRNFQVGDCLVLKEWDPGLTRYTGREVEVYITHITPAPDFGIPEGYAVLSVTRVRLGL